MFLIFFDAVENFDILITSDPSNEKSLGPIRDIFSHRLFQKRFANGICDLGGGGYPDETQWHLYFLARV